MKITIEGFIVAKQDKWESEPRFTWFAHKPNQELSDMGYVVVAPHTIVTEISEDFDISTAKIYALHARKAALKSKLAADLEQLDNEIQNCWSSLTKEQL